MELRDYLNVIRARKWVIIQAVVIVTLTAVVASYLQPPVYEGEAKILISERDAGVAIFGTVLPEISSQPERGLQTQVQLMQVRPLLENTIRDLGLGVTPDELVKRVSVSAVGQTNIVRITVKDGDADRAAAIANTLAGEFVGWSRASKRESVRAAADEVEVRLEASKSEILELGRKIESEGKSDELDAELRIAIGTYTTLAEKLEQLKINEQLEIGAGRVVSPAVPASEPVEPSPIRNGALGLAVGLVFGLGMAFLYEYLDNTIKTAEDVEQVYGAPVLGLIPAEKGVKRQLTLLANPGSAAAEAYRVLRNSVDFINFQHDTKTLLVTSAAPAEGKSTVAANLAAGLAQAGGKVILVECDFRRPTTEQFFGVSNMIGLSDVLLGANSLKSALRRPNDELNLQLLTSGKLPPNPSELLGSGKMRELIGELEQWADWVIVDTPPLLTVADGAAVARHADGVLMVLKGGESTRDAAKTAAEMLEQVGARVLGSVIWGLESGPGAMSAYGYGRYGGYYHYADYYNAPQAAGRSKKAPAKAQVQPQAAAVGIDDGPRAVYIPPKSPGRRFAEGVGKFLTGFLAVLAVIVILAIVVYFLDQAMGWGIVSGLLKTG